jgi:hypothetical protein
MVGQSLKAIVCTSTHGNELNHNSLNYNLLWRSCLPVIWLFIRYDGDINTYVYDSQIF